MHLCSRFESGNSMRWYRVLDDFGEGVSLDATRVKKRYFHP